MLRDFPEKEANFRPLWTQFTPDSSLQVRVGFPYAVGQRRVCPDVDARFAQGQRSAAAYETVGLVECEGRPGETMPDNELCAAFGLARPTRARLHRGVHRGAAELGSCRQRLGDGLLLGVVRCGSFVRVTCKYPAVGRGYDRTDAVGRRRRGYICGLRRPPCRRWRRSSSVVSGCSV